MLGWIVLILIYYGFVASNVYLSILLGLLIPADFAIFFSRRFSLSKLN